MSTFQANQSNGFSPLLLSPSSTSHPIIANNHLILFDNSDQGSVDSDYTSLGSSKFYGNGGSSSSLHRQGRSQSIDELASTTNIPTRHFNGTLNVNKLNNDPLQFVKIHPNHELIERAQEQLTLLESRKRLQETFKLNAHIHNLSINNNINNNTNASPTTNITTSRKPSTTSTSSIQNHLATRPRQSEVYEDYSEAVENWRLKREEKRKQSLKPTQSDDASPLSSPIIESTPSSSIKKSDETEIKSNLRSPSPPTVVLSSSTTNESTDQLTVKNRIPLKSPSPQRIKGPAKIHEIYIQKAVDIRGFGFKLDGGSLHNRPIYISTLEDGSPADKAGLCVEDEIISMHGENIEYMTFDQVRKILKERNLRGSIRLVVRTFEDIIDDSSQTLTVGLTTGHSRTPSPQKLASNSQPTILPVSPPPTTSRTIPVTSPTPSNIHAPIYTFLPYTPPPLRFQQLIQL
ncbi:hypothetical protein I4U23_018818 [Adineta vaga]|nr:hypothetical protein I4U23_018818 [Adineta vaga]